MRNHEYLPERTDETDVGSFGNHFDKRFEEEFIDGCFTDILFTFFGFVGGFTAKARGDTEIVGGLESDVFGDEIDVAARGRDGDAGKSGDRDVAVDGAERDEAFGGVAGDVPEAELVAHLEFAR